MTYRGRVQNGVVVFESGVSPVDGAIVEVVSVDDPRVPSSMAHESLDTGGRAKKSDSLPEPSDGKAMLAFAGTISHDDLRLMAEAIEEGCGKVDPTQW